MNTLEVPVIRNARTEITASEPPIWSFYNVQHSTYSQARPVECWTDKDGEWIEALTSVSPSSGNQYRLTTRWDAKLQEWVVTDRQIAN